MANPPSTEKFGTRFFTELIARAIAEYLRHEPGIDRDLPAGVKEALAVIVENLPAILALNPPGPE